VTADGQFGPKTTQAVKTFQAKQCLVADGIIGVRTFALLCWVKPGVC
jgi:peptidoglycan hydrolase-like protein with peptidoglycan-binding domain